MPCPARGRPTRVLLPDAGFPWDPGLLDRCVVGIAGGSGSGNRFRAAAGHENAVRRDGAPSYARMSPRAALGSQKGARSVDGSPFALAGLWERWRTRIGVATPRTRNHLPEMSQITNFLEKRFPGPPLTIHYADLLSEYRRSGLPPPNMVQEVTSGDERGLWAHIWEAMLFRHLRNLRVDLLPGRVKKSGQIGPNHLDRGRGARQFLPAIGFSRTRPGHQPIPLSGRSHVPGRSHSIPDKSRWSAGRRTPTHDPVFDPKAKRDQHSDRKLP
jgi:hypothetical protein